MPPRPAPSQATQRRLDLLSKGFSVATEDPGGVISAKSNSVIVQERQVKNFMTAAPAAHLAAAAETNKITSTFLRHQAVKNITAAFSAAVKQVQAQAQPRSRGALSKGPTVAALPQPTPSSKSKTASDPVADITAFAARVAKLRARAARRSATPSTTATNDAISGSATPSTTATNDAISGSATPSTTATNDAISGSGTAGAGAPDPVDMLLGPAFVTTDTNAQRIKAIAAKLGVAVALESIVSLNARDELAGMTSFRTGASEAALAMASTKQSRAAMNRRAATQANSNSHSAHCAHSKPSPLSAVNSNIAPISSVFLLTEAFLAALKPDPSPPSPQISEALQFLAAPGAVLLSAPNAIHLEETEVGSWIRTAWRDFATAAQPPPAASSPSPARSASSPDEGGQGRQGADRDAAAELYGGPEDTTEGTGSAARPTGVGASSPQRPAKGFPDCTLATAHEDVAAVIKSTVRACELHLRPSLAYYQGRSVHVFRISSTPLLPHRRGVPSCSRAPSRSPCNSQPRDANSFQPLINEHSAAIARQIRPPFFHPDGAANEIKASATAANRSRSAEVSVSAESSTARKSCSRHTSKSPAGRRIPINTPDFLARNKAACDARSRRRDAAVETAVEPLRPSTHRKMEAAGKDWFVTPNLQSPHVAPTPSPEPSRRPSASGFHASKSASRGRSASAMASSEQPPCYAVIHDDVSSASDNTGRVSTTYKSLFAASIAASSHRGVAAAGTISSNQKHIHADKMLEKSAHERPDVPVAAPMPASQQLTRTVSERSLKMDWCPSELDESHPPGYVPAIPQSPPRSAVVYVPQEQDLESQFHELADEAVELLRQSPIAKSEVSETLPVPQVPALKRNLVDHLEVSTTIPDIVSADSLSAALPHPPPPVSFMPAVVAAPGLETPHQSPTSPTAACEEDPPASFALPTGLNGLMGELSMLIAQVDHTSTSG